MPVPESGCRGIPSFADECLQNALQASATPRGTAQAVAQRLVQGAAEVLPVGA